MNSQLLRARIEAKCLPCKTYVPMRDDATHVDNTRCGLTPEERLALGGYRPAEPLVPA